MCSTELPDDSKQAFSPESRLGKKIALNYRKNKEQDHTPLMDEKAQQFSYEDCKEEYWNPEKFSLLYGTPLWNEASEHQKRLLNQLYWVAYYSQIISAEIATILFNQTSAAGLFGIENFRPICDMLDLESAQERAHIYAFKRIAEEVEKKLFGKRIFTYPMRGPYLETMIFGQSNRIKAFWKSLQLRSFALLSSGNAFIGCQYFTVRGLRTLNGKLIQHQLSQFYTKSAEKESAPIPSKISYYHFMDESFHFNSSRMLSHEVLKSLKKPTAFERLVINLGVWGCQKDHSHFSTAINGIFWYDPALFESLYQVLHSSVFGFNRTEALAMLEKCFTEESEGMQESFQTHQKALESYESYVEDLDFLHSKNRSMQLMKKNSSLQKHLKENQKRFQHFRRKKEAERV